jgi:Tfp pilus assembly protein PilN
MRAVNLLPDDLRGPAKAVAPVTSVPEDSGGSGAFFALGGLALCVLAVAGYVLTTNSIKQHESDLAALESRHQVVTAESARLKPYADFATMATTRVATVRDLATRRFDWERALRDLSRALPADVSVSQLAGSVSTQGGGGALRGAINAPAIEIAGCAADQPSVARMMARLRGANGVTRVSLEKSSKSGSDDAAAQSAAADSAAQGTPVTGCEGKGKSDPADFAVVVFFENDASASADPAASAPPVGAAPGAGTTDSGAPAQAAGATPTPTPTAPTTEPADAGTSTPTSTEAE